MDEDNENFTLDTDEVLLKAIRTALTTPSYKEQLKILIDIFDVNQFFDQKGKLKIEF